MKKKKKKKKYRHITKEKFIFIQNKIGGSMKCQSMIFIYRKNIQKQWVLASLDLKLTIAPSTELISSTGGFEEISIISKEIFKVPQEN